MANFSSIPAVMSSYPDRFYPEKAKGVVRAPASEWIAVNNGEVGPMSLLMQGKLKVKGSLAMAGKFQTMFKPGSEL